MLEGFPFAGFSGVVVPALLRSQLLSAIWIVLPLISHSR